MHICQTCTEHSHSVWLGGRVEGVSKTGKTTKEHLFVTSDIKNKWCRETGKGGGGIIWITWEVEIERTSLEEVLLQTCSCFQIFKTDTQSWHSKGQLKRKPVTDFPILLKILCQWVGALHKFLKTGMGEMALFGPPPHKNSWQATTMNPINVRLTIKAWFSVWLKWYNTQYYYVNMLQN